MAETDTNTHAATALSKMESPEQPLCHIVAPVGMLGHGFDEALIRHELAVLVPTGVPTALILDSGSTDSGPEKLALGCMTCPRSAYAADLSKLLRLAHAFRVPVIFSSAGGDGTDEHVREMEEIIGEIMAEEGNEDYYFKILSIFSGIDKTTILDRLEKSRLTGCGSCVPPATREAVEASPRVVAQMGPEPFIDAMDAEPDFDVIIGGRAYDPSPYAAYCAHQLKKRRRNQQQHRRYQSHHQHATATISAEADDDNYYNIDPLIAGGFLHMGKIMECGGHCSSPKSHGAVATVYARGVFDMRPTAPESACTPLTVAAHTLYEKTRPDVLHGPGGELHLANSTYEQLADGRTVRVRGARFESSVGRDGGQPYRVKLEAASVVGHRSGFLGGVKDRILISQLDKLLPLVKAYVAQQHSHVTDHWDLGFHVYGKGTTKSPSPSPADGGVFIVGEALAPTQKLANSIASKARIAMIHAPYPGQKATAGNMGFGIGGLMEIEMGPCAEFSLYHLMDLEPGEERLFVGEGGEKGEAEAESTESRSTFGHQDRRRLFRGSVSIVGKGSPKPPLSEEFKAHIAKKLRDSLADTSSSPSSSSAMEKKLATAHAAAEQQQHSSHHKYAPTTKRARAPRTLSDVCRVLRSKNAGPFEVTMDAMFSSEADYRRIKDSKVLSPDRVAQALGIPREDIIWMGFFDPARAFKVTIPRVRSGRKKSAGGFMEDDVHGSQEHLGLADIELPGMGGGIWFLPAVVFGGGRGDGAQDGWSRLRTAAMAALGGVGIVTVARRFLASKQ